MGGENAGAAALAVGLFLVGGLLIVGAARGTYRDVWAALIAPPLVEKQPPNPPRGT